jgi:hypothetical protein
VIDAQKCGTKQVLKDSSLYLAKRVDARFLMFTDPLISNINIPEKPTMVIVAGTSDEQEDMGQLSA